MENWNDGMELWKLGRFGRPVLSDGCPHPTTGSNPKMGQGGREREGGEGGSTKVHVHVYTCLHIHDMYNMQCLLELQIYNVVSSHVILDVSQSQFLCNKLRTREKSIELRTFNGSTNIKVGWPDYILSVWRFGPAQSLLARL